MLVHFLIYYFMQYLSNPTATLPNPMNKAPTNKVIPTNPVSG